jgi:hypothetical protein
MQDVYVTTSKLSFTALIIIPLAFDAGAALAVETSISLGYYEPFDGVVKGVFRNNAPSYLMRLGIPRDDGLSWSSTLVLYDFESRVANLENEVRMVALNTGFRKNFLEPDAERKFGLEPFFGASAGLAMLHVTSEDESTETDYSEKSAQGISSSWEVGIQVKNVVLRGFDFEFRMTDLNISRKLFGNLNMGGRIMSFGLQYRFPI